MLSVPTELLVVFRPNDPSPIAFLNVYKPGDWWVKVQGCEKCPRHCCGTCPLASTGQCYIHLINSGQDKPFHCCVAPTPIDCMPTCVLVWQCVVGENLGKYRWKCDPRDTLRNHGP